MEDLISRPVLKNKMKFTDACGRDGVLYVRFLDVKNAIDNTPAIDAVPVVRCRDCKQAMLWRKPADKVIGECFIRKMNSEDEQFCMVGADDFCSYGERKDGE